MDNKEKACVICKMPSCSSAVISEKRMYFCHRAECQKHRRAVARVASKRIQKESMVH